MTQQPVRERVDAPELAGAGGWINTAEPLSLAKLRGRVVVLDFWTFCCINCLHIIEELRPLEAAFPKELVVIGVHSPKFPEEHDHEAVVRAVARHRITHPVLDDPDMITWNRYGVRAWPTLMLIDATGAVRGSVSGEGHGKALMQGVAGLIEEAKRNGDLAPERPIRLAGTAAARGVPATAGMLAFPGKVASDGGKRLAIADTAHDRVLIATLDGRVEQEFGGLREPQGLCFDGDRLVVANCLADEVVAIDLRSGDRLVLARGISSPWDVALWQDGIAVAEAGRHRLWFIPNRAGSNGVQVVQSGAAAEGQAARVLAGTSGENLIDGPALRAQLAQPSGLTVTTDGTLLFADSEVSALRELQAGVVTTLVGKGLFEWGTADGDSETARLQHPLGVAAAPDGAVYVADTFNSRLRVWRDGRLTTLPVHGLNEPGGLCVLSDGRLVVADTNNHRIVFVDTATGEVTPLALGSAGESLITERQLAAAEPVRVRATLDLAGDDLDPSDGPPVRLSVSADPPRLLAAGPRSWALDSLPAEVDILTGDGGEGTITLDLRAASCTGDECHLHTRRFDIPVRLVADGVSHLEA
jgi:thiol-disulfide isomerase/thioredoxin/DNA-binding beta-propeller fold protein YncE